MVSSQTGDNFATGIGFYRGGNRLLWRQSYTIAQDYVDSAGCVTRIGYEKQEICEMVNELSREVENDTVRFNGKGRIVSTMTPSSPGLNFLLRMAANGGR
ncbi:MAG: hypothetical protein ABL863_12750 [Nitrosomonas sp.]